MKLTHRLFQPSTWSLTALLSIVLLLLTWLPVMVLIGHRPQYQNLLSIAVLGAIATALSLLLADWLTKPVRLLTRAAKAVERGNFMPPGLAEITQAENDIGYLAWMFTKMGARVKAAQEQRINQHVTDVLLRELNSRDIHWLNTVGHYREVTAGTLLTEAGCSLDTFYLVLDGLLSMTVSQFAGNHLDRVYAQTDPLSAWEITRLGSGEVVGERLLTDASNIATTTVTALEPTLVLTIPHTHLTTQLKQDAGFAARFYRAIAILLSHRLQSLIAQVGYNAYTQEQPIRDVLSVLSALHDSDIDWLVAIGQRQKIPTQTVLIQQGRTVDALYILLRGTLTVSTFNDVCNPFVGAFSLLEPNATTSQTITNLTKGEMVGETAFLTTNLPATTIAALEDCLVLAIPRSHLIVKLEQDIGFAARFYRMLANLQSNRLQECLDRLGYVAPIESQNHTMNSAMPEHSELNFHVLDQMAIAGTRFDWLLRRLGGTEPA